MKSFRGHFYRHSSSKTERKIKKNNEQVISPSIDVNDNTKAVDTSSKCPECGKMYVKLIYVIYIFLKYI